MARISAALSNPNKISLEALGEENIREKLIFDHFKKFFTNSAQHQQGDPTLESFMHEIDPSSINRISDDDNLKLVSPVSIVELKKIAKLLKKNKSTSLDHISNEMLIQMLNLTPEPFLNHFNDCITKGKKFHSYFRQSYLKLIPKKTSPELVTSWRPISIASNVFKIYSKLLYLRLDSIVDKLLCAPQKGFRKSCNINDVTNNIRSKLDSLKEKDIPGFLMSLNFRSAFDSISFDYIPKMLKFFWL